MTLLDNAVRYSWPHGQICVSICNEGGQARVLIDDEIGRAHV